MQLHGLISDLVLILCSAAVVSLIFKKLRQPVVLGYILVGLLLGPNFNLFPTIVETEGIKTWAEIGVIFLLFGLGLEFSFKKLMKVGGVAVVTALIGVLMTMLSGYLIGSLMGWKNVDSLFLGGILAIASTTIIFRAFEELKVKSHKFAGIVMGVLVVEDLVAVVLMVLLSTVAVGRELEGAEMIYSVIKLVFFLILWFVSGIFFLPTFLNRIKPLMTTEILLIVSLALCFLMVALATRAGFSPALGAFIMGSILAETASAEKIDHTVQSLKSLFGAIFFVSVGMLIDPEMLMKHALPVTIAVLVLLIVKPFFVTVGALITGQPLRIAVQTGMSLSQIGEFSFIIATLGLTLNVTSNFLYPIAVAVSVITTFTTPFMIRYSESFYMLLDRRLPGRWNMLLHSYSLGAQNISEESSWQKLMRSYFTNILVFSVVITTIILLSTNYLVPLIGDDIAGRLVTLAITLILLSPFLWALAFHRTHPEIYNDLWQNPTERGPLITLFILRISLTAFFIGFLFQKMYSTLASLIGLVITCILIVIFRKRVKSFYGMIELRFFRNLRDRETEDERAPALTPWDSHMAVFELSPNSQLIGKTLLELTIRERFGINIAVIKRGDKKINVPSRYERLYPNDIISVIGTDDQLQQFRNFLDSDTATPPGMGKEKHEVSLQHFTVADHSALVGKSILESGIRELSHGLIVGVERGGRRILNPESTLQIEAGDKLWIVGSEKRIQVLAKQSQM